MGAERKHDTKRDTAEPPGNRQSDDSRMQQRGSKVAIKEPSELPPQLAQVVTNLAIFYGSCSLSEISKVMQTFEADMVLDAPTGVFNGKDGIMDFLLLIKLLVAFRLEPEFVKMCVADGKGLLEIHGILQIGLRLLDAGPLEWIKALLPISHLPLRSIFYVEVNASSDKIAVVTARICNVPMLPTWIRKWTGWAGSRAAQITSSFWMPVAQWMGS